MVKRGLFFILLISIFVIAFFVGERASINFEPPTSNLTPSPTSQVNQEEVIVKRVVDGDTIELEDGRRVRYIGMDTPELKDQRETVECFTKEAMEKNKELVEGKKVRLEKDVSETDKFGRLLRYVYVNEVFINDYLIRQGYASVATFPPDVKYQSQFVEAEREAREFKRGLWYNCQAKTP